ncbi:hypothetical protein [Leptolyngbya sp. FACHB-711]|uniref:hypothetical protein n=1 Tax=Leptolyngbya sp. FACHB-711 TaxID=2692813 RepID=UPI0016846D5D|nr:hypothetical protein [Leptolyngbya sp. FACHB-711]MBD1852741.1 hypothetical protein [Cyanobacteria bacterium FACHB-502]MBD2022876.1 hypothetical protein [Leptolyngbya sp. FACHB-711]
MLLSQLSPDDPMMAMLAQMMAQRQSTPAVDEDDEEDRIDREEMERQAEEKSQAMAKALRHLRSKIDDLYAELGFLARKLHWRTTRSTGLQPAQQRACDRFFHPRPGTLAERRTQNYSLLVSLLSNRSRV